MEHRHKASTTIATVLRPDERSLTTAAAQSDSSCVGDQLLHAPAAPAPSPLENHGAGAVADGRTCRALAASWPNSGEQVGILGELDGVFERQTGGAGCVAGHDERGDFDELAFASSGGTTLLLGARDVTGRGGVVTPTRGQHGEEGVLDGEVGHGFRMRRGADPGLTCR